VKQEIERLGQVQNTDSHEEAFELAM